MLPYGFVNLGLKFLKLEDNESLQFPPKGIAREGSEAVIHFFEQLQKGRVQVNHAKLMLVGHGRAGKSTLSKALTMKSDALLNLMQELKDKAGMVSQCCVFIT